MSHDHAHDRATDAESAARDRFVEALLRTHHERPLERERRVDRAMRAVRHDARSAGWGARLARSAGGLAAVAAVVAAAIIFTPSSVSAADRARATMQGERAARDRRVMFLLNPPAHESERPTLTGTLDVRDARHMVLTIRRPDGREVVHGISGDTAWRIDASGEVHDEPADHPWPVWIRSPRGGLLVDIAETIESGLAPGWTWSVTKAEAGEDRLVAQREGGPRAEPTRMQASIDAQTGRVKRLQIEWPSGGAPMPPDRDADDARRPPPPPDGRPHPHPPMGAPAPEAGGMRPPHDRAGGPSQDGPRPPRGDHAGAPAPPMGPPSSMVIVPEPPVTFTDDWFTPARHMPERAP